MISLAAIQRVDTCQHYFAGFFLVESPAKFIQQRVSLMVGWNQSWRFQQQRLSLNWLDEITNQNALLSEWCSYWTPSLSLKNFLKTFVTWSFALCSFWQIMQMAFNFYFYFTLFSVLQFMDLWLKMNCYHDNLQSCTDLCNLKFMWKWWGQETTSETENYTY